MWAAIKANGRWWGEVWDRRKSGAFYCESLSICAVRDERGEITNYCAVFADITGRKIAQAELLRLNAELEERVATRTLELVRTIHGFSQLVLKDQESRLDEVSVDHQSRIAAGAQRMAGPIDDLLQPLRISQQEMRRRTLHLSELSAKVIETLAQAHPELNVDVVIAPAMTVEGDPGLLHIVLENLLGNAWTFTARTQAARIEIGRTEGDGELTYLVRDNGAGFDMKYADKLFIAFQRLHTPAEFEATGIGLSIVQRIVARHGGRIWTQAKAAEGATFCFTLGKSERPA